MKHFSRELAEILKGPPKISQTELAAKTKMQKSKISRLLTGQNAVDKETLDAVLRAFSSRDSRARLVAAYIKDAVPDSALRTLLPEGWEGVDASRLSARGETALRALLQSNHWVDVERVLVDLATLFDLI
jgi:hypothetical protein